MTAQRFLDVWYQVIVVVVAGSIWVGFSHWGAEQLTGITASTASGDTLMYIGCVIVVASGTKALVFAGPRRASVAAMSWSGRGTQRRHLLQVGLAVALIYSVQVVFLGMVAMQQGWASATIAALCAALAGALATLFVVFAVSQRSRGRQAGPVLLASLALALIAILIGHAAGVSPKVSLAAAGLVLVGGLVWELGVLKDLAPAVPRWSLVAADRNVSALAMSISMLDESNLRLLSDRSQRSRKAAFRFYGPRSVGLWWTVVRRTVTPKVGMALFFVVVALLSSSVFGLSGTNVVSLVAAIIMSMSMATGWTDYLSTPAARAFLFPGAKHVTAAVFQAHVLLPQVTAFVPLLLVGRPSLGWLLLAIVVPAHVLLARGSATTKSVEMGPLGAMVHVPEVGVIPAGVAGSVTAGWLSAGALVLLAVATSPGIALVGLTVLMARNLSTLNRLRSRRLRQVPLS